MAFKQRIPQGGNWVPAGSQRQWDPDGFHPDPRPQCLLVQTGINPAGSQLPDVRTCNTDLISQFL
ncbi:hypothetical protein K439DRAFT_1635361, partial [Ramaria rubella]